METPYRAYPKPANIFTRVEVAGRDRKVKNGRVLVTVVKKFYRTGPRTEQ
jgi:hypothetical protein